MCPLPALTGRQGGREENVVRRSRRLSPRQVPENLPRTHPAFGMGDVASSLPHPPRATT